MNLTLQAADEATFGKFFLAAEASRHNKALRSQINVSDVEQSVQRLLPGAIRTTRLRGSFDVEKELTQDFYVQAFDHGLSLYKPGYSFTQYARHLILLGSKTLQRWHRSARRKAAEDMLNDMAAGGLDIPERASQLQTYEQIRSVIEQLQTKLNEAACLVWIDGLKIWEAARVLEQTPNTTALRLNRARPIVLSKWRSVRVKRLARRERATQPEGRAAGNSGRGRKPRCY